jgi:biotin synthase
VARTIACARIAVPGAKVRLSAGRTELSEEAQALCFFAGANSIFYGDKLLTAANPQTQQDLRLLEKLGMKTQEPNRELEAPATQPQRPLSPAPA